MKMQELLEAASRAHSGEKRQRYSSRELERRKAGDASSLAGARSDGGAAGGCAASPAAASQRESERPGNTEEKRRKNREAMTPPCPDAEGRENAGTQDGDAEPFPLFESVLAFQLYLVLLTNPAYIRRYGRRLHAAVVGLFSQADEGERLGEEGSRAAKVFEDRRVAQTACAEFPSLQERAERPFARREAQTACTAGLGVCDRAEGSDGEGDSGVSLSKGGEENDSFASLCGGRDGLASPQLSLETENSLLPSELVLAVLNFAATAPSPALSLPLCSPAASSSLSHCSASSFETPSSFAVLLSSRELQRASLDSLLSSLPEFGGSASQRSGEGSRSLFSPVILQLSDAFGAAAERQALESGCSSAAAHNPFQSGAEEREASARERRQSDDAGGKNPFSPHFEREEEPRTRPECRGDSRGRTQERAADCAVASREAKHQNDLLLLDAVRERLALTPFLPPLRASVSLLAAVLDAPKRTREERRGDHGREREGDQKREREEDQKREQEEDQKSEREGEPEGEERASSESDVDACGRSGVWEFCEERVDGEELRRLLQSEEQNENEGIEEALLRLVRDTPITSTVRVSTAQATLVEALLQVCPSPVDNPVAFSRLFPLFVGELCKTFLHPHAFFRDSASFAVGCRVLLELQILFRSSFISLLWQDYRRMQEFLSVSSSSSSSVSSSVSSSAFGAGLGEEREVSVQQMKDDTQPGLAKERRRSDRQEEAARRDAQVNGEVSDETGKTREARRGNKRSEKTRRDESGARGKAERGMRFVDSNSFARRRPQQEAWPCAYATATGIRIDKPQPTLGALQARGCTARESGNQESARRGGDEAATREQAARRDSQQEAGPAEDGAPQRPTKNEAKERKERNERKERKERKEMNDGGQEGGRVKGRGETKDAVGFADEPFEVSPGARRSDACACRSRPCLQCKCGHSPTGVLLLSAVPLFDALTVLASSRASPSLDRLQVWKLAVQTACVLVEDASCFLSHLSWLSPASRKEAACAPHCPASGEPQADAFAGAEEKFWTAATHTLQSLLRILSTPPLPARSSEASGNARFAPAAGMLGLELEANGRTRTVQTEDGLAEAGSQSSALPSAFFFDRWILRIAADALAKPARRDAPSATLYPFFVSVLDYYCTASSERPAGIAHEAFCTLFDLSEDRFTCILPRSPAVSSVGDAASTRRRMQSVLPLVLRRCRGILQRFATSSMSSPTSASSASVNSSVNSLGSLPCSAAEAHRSAGRLPSGDRGASSSVSSEKQRGKEAFCRQRRRGGPWLLCLTRMARGEERAWSAFAKP
ncbi:hypothetical protein TGRUB_432580 [Toxoplasma gondii RUB]|uniref:Uncharacterized protein n=1 Tax=Toxoplasma gondii RUB TaxID=935652 RepID=A0A086LRA2_TOXGO|nr:hypothetical protein TGRUB_432580 [Toxoplasma gondii RUB]